MVNELVEACPSNCFRGAALFDGIDLCDLPVCLMFVVRFLTIDGITLYLLTEKSQSEYFSDPKKKNNL